MILKIADKNKNNSWFEEQKFFRRSSKNFNQMPAFDVEPDQHN